MCSNKELKFSTWLITCLKKIMWNEGSGLNTKKAHGRNWGPIDLEAGFEISSSSLVFPREINSKSYSLQKEETGKIEEEEKNEDRGSSIHY